MRLGRNLLAGLAGSIWSALLGLAVVPFYLKYLGIEAYGLIGFFVTTQSLLQLLDLGLAPAINREVARGVASGNLEEARRLLHTLAVIYWGMAIVIALIVIGLAPLIARYWLQSNHLPQSTVSQAMMLMGLVIACRWPIGLYQSALMGAQRLTVSSSVTIAMVTLASAGAIGVLALVSPTIQAFFLWQAFVGFVYAGVARLVAWRIVGRSAGTRFDVDGLKRIFRFSAGMSGVAVSGLILMQLDKVLLSRIVSLADFGRYALAALVASGLYVLLTPVFNVIFPRMSGFVATDDTQGLVNFYRTGTRWLSAALFPAAAAVAFLAQDLVCLWTGNIDLASSVAPIISLLVVGTALNGAMHFPYALQLAYGMTRLPLMINLILMLVLVPVIIVLALNYGAIGGAAAWVLLNFLYLLLGTWLTHRYLLKGIALKWLLGDVVMPLLLSLLIVGIGTRIMIDMAWTYYVRLLVGCGLAVLGFISIVFVSPHLRGYTRHTVSQIMRRFVDVR